MTHVPQVFEHLLGEYGIAALFVSVALEALGAPLPGESAVILAAGAAAAGRLDIRTVVIAAFAAAVLGDNIGYLIGRRLGRPAILRYGARLGVTDRRLARAEAIVRRHGPVIVVVARFVVVLRQLNGIVAGSTGMHWLSFLAANAVGAALWVGLWSTLVYRFGHSTAILPFFWHHLSLAAAVAVPLLVAGLATLHWRRRG